MKEIKSTAEYADLITMAARNADELETSLEDANRMLRRAIISISTHSRITQDLSRHLPLANLRLWSAQLATLQDPEARALRTRADELAANLTSLFRD